MSRHTFGRRSAVPVAALAALALTVATAGARDLEERVERMEQLLDSQALGQLSNRQERLREQVSELSGEIDSLRNELESLRERQRNLFQDLDDRLLALEEAQENDDQGNGDDDGDGDGEDGGDDEETDREPTTGDGRPPEAEETPDGGDNGSDGEAASVYQDAFDLLRDGDYRAAADGFRTVIEDHSDSDYADNARYWLGETYYVEREFDEAMEHFGALLDRSESNKHADALLKAGYIHYEREEWDRARELLERVREEYPDDSVAELAADRLERMNDNDR